VTSKDEKARILAEIRSELRDRVAELEDEGQVVPFPAFILTVCYLYRGGRRVICGGFEHLLEAEYISRHAFTVELTS